MLKLRIPAYLLLSLLCFTICLFDARVVTGQSTGFTYQGRLTDNNLPANGNYDFEFKLFTALVGGTQDGTPRQLLNVPVANGIFSLLIDFGAGAFPGADRFLEIAVKPAGIGSFTTLNPRQQLNLTPYAINAINAANAIQLGGLNAAQYVQTSDSRLTDARIPLPNNGNYIQNRTTQQTGSNFNVSGNGTVGGILTGDTVNALTQFNLNNNRILGRFGANNLYVGILAGSANSGAQNTLVGDGAGQHTTGDENALFGFVAGQLNTSGMNNSFFGSWAGNTNTTGNNNTILGSEADVSASNLNNASAIGYRSLVEASNALVLGGVNGRNGAASDTNVGIGTTAPGVPLDIESQLAGSANLRVTNYGGRAVMRSRSAPGTRSAPVATLLNDILFELQTDGHTGNAFTANGRAKIVVRSTQNWTSTANGTAMDFFTTPNNTTTPLQRLIITHSGSVGIGRSDADQLLDVNGDVRVGLGGGTSGCVEDRNATVIAGSCSSDLRFKRNITPFASLLDNFARLRPVHFFWRKEEFADKHFGDQQSYGLIAQEVEPLFPELVSTDEQGYKVVNYSKLPLLTIQAVKELRQENDALKAQLQSQQAELAIQLQRQQQQIVALRKLLCSQNPRAGICQ